MIDQEKWTLAQRVTRDLLQALPKWAAECLTLDWAQIATLPRLDEAGTGSLAQPTAETKEVSSQYLDHLREQIELGARGPDWTSILRRRLSTLEPLQGTPILTVSLYSKPAVLTLRIQVGPERVIGYEVLESASH